MTAARRLAAILAADVHRPIGNDRLTCAPCQGGAFQWVQAPPGETLQPEATGAVMEVTKWLEPSV
jgi:hypothetical protein